jgi:hypothetical protein
MKILVEFISISENSELKLKEKTVQFKKLLPDCEIEYLHKGEYKKYSNGRISKLPTKNSNLTISIYAEELDYNKIITDMLTTYKNLKNYYKNIEHHSFINLSFFSDDMISLEFSKQVLSLLSKNNFSLPISCYRSVN